MKGLYIYITHEMRRVKHAEEIEEGDVCFAMTLTRQFFFFVAYICHEKC